MLKNLDKDIKLRNKKAKIFNKILINKKNIIIPNINKNFIHAFYRYNIILLSDYKKITKLISNINLVFPFISNYGSCPIIYEENVFKKNKYSKGKIINANKIKNKVISINFSNLNLNEVKQLGNIIINAIN